MGRRHDLRLGTCGWSYPDWVGPFYAEGTDPGAFLTAYALHFDTVEVDSTFYRMPTAEQIDHWRQMTPRNFQFCLKVPQLITHEKVLQGCRDDFRNFAEAVRGLGNKLRCVLLQFGYFNKQAFAHHKSFFERLDQFLAAAAPEELPIAVEIRNKTWLNPQWFELLKKHHASTVLIDHPWMPSIPEVIEKYDVDTGPLAYVRLLGDREAIEKQTQSWGKTVVDRAAPLRDLAASLQELNKHIDVVVFANNHYAGHAPATLTDFSALIGREPSIHE
ncbi:MAG: DUF72 domain-containing protein [Phycisphaerae bacterium]